MTSKISYSKFIKEDIRRRGWLLVLSAVLLFLCVTVTTLLMLEASFSNISQDELAEQWNIYRTIFPGLLNGSYNLLLFAALLLLGGLCAVTGFSWAGFWSFWFPIWRPHCWLSWQALRTGSLRCLYWADAFSPYWGAPWLSSWSTT